MDAKPQRRMEERVNTPTVAHRTTLLTPLPSSIILVPLAAHLTPRSDVAIMVARLKHELERLGPTDRAYVVEMVQRHIVAGVLPEGA